MKETIPILAASERAFFHHAAMNPWLMGLLFVAAGAMIFYLYLAQQRIASRRMVGALTFLRLGLVLLLFLLLLQPGYRWKHTRQSAGTLWLMLDGSQSMARTDPQSTPLERLRWADALDRLPQGLRTFRIDETSARLGCLRDDLARLQSPSAFASRNDSGAGGVDRFRETMKAWQRDLDAAADQLAIDARSKPAIAPIAESLRKLSGLVTGALDTGAPAATVADAIKPVPWPAIDLGISTAVKGLDPIADETDRAFLAAHGNEPPVLDALAKISALSRSDLALLELTQASKRLPQSLKELFPKYRIRIAGFADKAQSVSPGDAAELPNAIKQALQPKGQATSLSAALQLIGEQVVPDEPTSVLILSDGRQNTEGEADRSAQQLAAQGVRVYGIAIGSREPAVDVAIDDVDAPSWVYKNDQLTARATVRAEGLAGKELAVQFWRGGTKIDTKKVTPKAAAETQVIVFEDQHPEIGVFDYEVRVDGGEAEENKANNRQAFRLTVRKDPLKLLLVEDQPRWEYRHLVSYLSRDKSVKLQTVLLRPTQIDGVTPPSPVKASPTNPRPEAEQLPESPEEWAAFDVIMLGDVSRDTLPAKAQEAIVMAVKNSGKTLIVLAGPRAMPGTYLNAPLAEALPVEIAGEWPAEVLADHLKTGYRVHVTQQGAASVLGQLASDPAGSADLWAEVPSWYWHSEQTTAKPSASVLLSILDNAAPPADAEVAVTERRAALLATSSLGLGRVMYLAADQTWRLRQVNGQNLQDRFWGQVLRWALANDLPAGGQFVRFGSDRPRYAEGDAIVITARLSKEDHTPLTGQSFEVIAKLQSERAPSTAPATQPAVADKIVAQATLTELPESPGLYRATLKGVLPGQVELSLRGVQVEGLLKDVSDERLKTMPVYVQTVPTVEQRNTNPDRQKLADIAKAGGGAITDGPYAAVLAGFIPQPKVEDVRYEQLGLFGDPSNHYTRLSHWIFLAVFATLISAEWILRKIGGLV